MRSTYLLLACCTPLAVAPGFDAGPTAVQRELTVMGSSPAHGIFDFAPERDDAGTVWVSYSTVENSKYPDVVAVSTHLARSDDNGLSLTEVATLNASTAQPLDGFAFDGGIWEHEVSRLRHDPYAPPAEQWVLLWHRYLSLPAPVPADQQRRFEHGWIALKTAPSPTGDWSGERKLFTAEGYLSTDGPSEVALSTLSTELTDCVAVTEPSLLARPNDWLVSLQCVGPKTRIILLRRDRASATWAYLGSVLTTEDAATSGDDSFAATELVALEDRLVLIVSPSVGDAYRGCRAYALTSDTPPVVSASPLLTLGLGATDSGFAGACGFVDGLATGLIEGEVFHTAPEFRVFATFQNLPKDGRSKSH